MGNLLFVTVGILFLLAILFGIFALLKVLLRFLPTSTPEQLEAHKREELERLRAWEERVGKREGQAQLNPALICPHCQSKGTVHTRRIMQKAGVSGGKATAAVLTGGLSLVVAGLSRKEDRTQCACEHCGMTWIV